MVDRMVEKYEDLILSVIFREDRDELK